MAEKIKAYTTYGPKVKLGPIVSMTELVKFISGRTHLNIGELSLAMNEFHNAVYFYSRIGRPIKIPGLGIFKPHTRLDGKIRVGHRADPELKKRLNDSDGFEGELLNSEFIGQTYQQLIDRWNTDNPDDQIVP